MHYSVLLLGYILGGVLRGVLVALLVFISASFFLTLNFNHLPMTVLVVTLVSSVFSLAGFTNAMVARNFDDIMIIPTFVLTPLTYLGGVFYSIDMLPLFWQKLSYFNPILHTTNALRYAMIGQKTDIGLDMAIIASMLIILTLLNLYLLKKGIGLRE
jgi:ABC-2 type transport system permease protein